MYTIVDRYDNEREIWSKSTGNMGWNIVKRNAGSLIDDVKRDIAINFMLTWHKLNFLIGQFEFVV